MPGIKQATKEFVIVVLVKVSSIFTSRSESHRKFSLLDNVAISEHFNQSYT